MGDGGAKVGRGERRVDDDDDDCRRTCRTCRGFRRYKIVEVCLQTVESKAVIIGDTARRSSFRGILGTSQRLPVIWYA